MTRISLKVGSYMIDGFYENGAGKDGRIGLSSTIQWSRGKRNDSGSAARKCGVRNAGGWIA